MKTQGKVCRMVSDKKTALVVLKYSYEEAYRYVRMDDMPPRLKGLLWFKYTDAVQPVSIRKDDLLSEHMQRVMYADIDTLDLDDDLRKDAIEARFRQNEVGVEEAFDREVDAFFDDAEDHAKLEYTEERVTMLAETKVIALLTL